MAGGRAPLARQRPNPRKNGVRTAESRVPQPVMRFNGATACIPKEEKNMSFMRPAVWHAICIV
jgi:hypothetical protein